MAIFFGKSNNIEIFDEEFDELEFSLINNSIDDCPKISFVEIEINEVLSQYKPYMDAYFSVLGNKKTNFFTDISNYLSYELGNPTHCFDSQKIEKLFVFESVNCDENFKTLQNSEIKLNGINSVFKMNDEIISLAGVMGGESTACSVNTKKALVECAYFRPESIIGKSVKYNLNSDQTYKFERGVDRFLQEKALRRFIKIVDDHASIKNIKFKSFEYENYEEKTIPINVSAINKILGTEMEEAYYIDILKNLCKVDEANIYIPSYRHDISTQNDLAEEIARLIGYNNIESKKLSIKDKSYVYQKNTKQAFVDVLLDNGFNEVINFPFSSAKGKSSIRIDNPLDKNKMYLRTSLRESLVQNLLYNERRQQDSINFLKLVIRTLTLILMKFQKRKKLEL